MLPGGRYGRNRGMHDAGGVCHLALLLGRPVRVEVESRMEGVVVGGKECVAGMSVREAIDVQCKEALRNKDHERNAEQLARR